MRPESFMKKKLVTVLLCLAMVSGTGVNVLAAGTAETDAQVKQGVTANERAQELAGEVAGSFEKDSVSSMAATMEESSEESSADSPEEKIREAVTPQPDPEAVALQTEQEEKIQKLAEAVTEAFDKGSSAAVKESIEAFSDELEEIEDPVLRISLEEQLGQYQEAADRREKKEAQVIEKVQTVWNFADAEIMADADEESIEAAKAAVNELVGEELKSDLMEACDAAEYCLDNNIRPKAEVEAAQAAAAQEAAAQAAAQPVAGAYYGNCRITFYCTGSCCNGGYTGTASGAPLTPYVTVANGDLPFGTQVLIDGQVYVVQDRGVGAQQFDVCVASHAEADARGLYYTDVYIVG